MRIYITVGHRRSTLGNHACKVHVIDALRRMWRQHKLTWRKSSASNNDQSDNICKYMMLSKGAVYSPALLDHATYR